MEKHYKFGAIVYLTKIDISMKKVTFEGEILHLLQFHVSCLCFISDLSFLWIHLS